MWQCLGDNANLDLDVSADSCCTLLDDNEVIIENGTAFCPYCGSECVWVG